MFPFSICNCQLYEYENKRLNKKFKNKPVEKFYYIFYY